MRNRASNHRPIRPFPEWTRRSRLLLCALVVIVPARAASQRTARATPESLIAADHAVAVQESRGIAMLATSATRDVVVLYGRSPIIRGRDAMTALLDSVSASTRDRLTWTALRADVSADGTRGYTYGRGTRTTRASGHDSTSGIRYVAWWRRDADAWRIAALLLVDERAGADTSMRWPCAGTTAAVAHAAGDATHEVVAADSAFAARSLVAGPALAFADYVADDGVSLGGGGIPACGKRAVGAQFEGMAPDALVWSPITGDAAASGDLGYSTGTATIRGEHGARYSKYLTIWKRQGDGAWRFVADGGSSAPARQNALAAR